MGVSLWGKSPLYENRKVFITMDTIPKTFGIRAEGKGVSVRRGLKEAGVQTCESMDRNCI